MNHRVSSRGRLLGPAMLALAPLFVAIPAHAIQYETISGNICQSVYPPNSSLGTWLYHQSNGIWNASYQGGSPGFRYVFCPLTRTNGLSYSGLAYSYVDVDDNTGTLWCTAESEDQFGNVLYSQNVTTPSAGTNRQLYFSGLSSVAWGHYQFFCVMPNQSVVHSILYVEN